MNSSSSSLSSLRVRERKRGIIHFIFRSCSDFTCFHFISSLSRALCDICWSYYQLQTLCSLLPLRGANLWENHCQYKAASCENFSDILSCEIHFRCVTKCNSDVEKILCRKFNTLAVGSFTYKRKYFNREIGTSSWILITYS